MIGTSGVDKNDTLGLLLNGSISGGANLTSALPGGGVEPPTLPPYIRTTSMLLCIFILGIGVIGNVMVPLVILKTKDMRNSTNIFLMNLSLADLMVLLVCTPTVLVEVNSKPETWVLGEHMCKAVPFVELTVAHASVLTILAISFERYYAICEPLRAGYVCTKTRAILICLLAWTFAALFTSPIISFTRYEMTEYIDGTIVPACLTQADSWFPAVFFIFIISLFFILPLFILIFLYSVIAKHLMADTAASSTDGFNQRARKQVVLMLVTVVVSFFTCLLPFRIFTLPILVVADYRDEEYIDGTIVKVCLMQADTFWPAFYFIMSIAIFFGLPLAILIVLYTVIACHLMSNPGLVAPNSSSSATRYRRQVVMMLGTVVVSFFICLLPFRALTLCIIIAPPEYIFSLGMEKFYCILYFCRIMLYLNSAVNPILYNLMSSKFREGFRRLLGLQETDPLARKGTVTTSTLTTSSSRKSSSDNHLLRRSVVRVISLEDSKSMKLLHGGHPNKEESYV